LVPAAGDIPKLNFTLGRPARSLIAAIEGEAIMKSSLRQTATAQHRPRPRGNHRPHPKTPSSGQHPRRRFLRLAAGAAALPAVSRMAWGQAYPSRPLTMNVPFPAGGAADSTSRIIAEHMRASLGQPVIIENVGGANGSIGVGRVARAVPDGYTFGIGLWSTHVTNGAIYALSYDVLNDFQPISPLTVQPYLIVAKKTLQPDDLQSFIAWLKSNPEKLSAATQGTGGSSHLSGLLFQSATGTRFQFVPYRGGGPAIQDLVGGQVDFMVASTGDAAQQVRAGTLKAYAVTAKSRSVSVPEVPTVDEAGLPGFYFSVWFGLWAPMRTPKDIISKLNAAVVDALAAPLVRTRLADLGQEIFPRDQQTPEALGTLQKSEIEKWWPIIKAANIKIE
jgi:tripartite-type tricarboxylate transporter receptor subunit TctC